MKGAIIAVGISYDDADPNHVVRLFKATLLLNGIRGVVSEPQLIEQIEDSGHVDVELTGEM